MVREDDLIRSARLEARNTPANRLATERYRILRILAQRDVQLGGREVEPNVNIRKKQIRAEVFATALKEGWAGENCGTRRHSGRNNAPIRRSKKGERQLRRQRHQKRMI